MSSTLTIVWAYLTLCLILGFFKVPKIRSLKDYAMGSNQFSMVTLALSLIAAFVDPYCTTAMAERGYTLGVVFTLPLLCIVIAWRLMAVLLSRAINYLKQHNCMTLPDIFDFYYGKLGRNVSILTTIVPSIISLSMFYKSAAFILERYLNMHFEYAAIIVTAAVALYSIFGGMHAIVITDVVQFFIFMTIFAIVFIWGFFNIDISTAVAHLPYEKTHVTSKDVPMFLGFLVNHSLPITGLALIQRALMCKNDNHVKTVFTFTGVFACVFLFSMSCIGMVVYGMNPDIKSDDALYYFMDHAVPESIVGFIAVSFLAIIMSSASSTLNALNVILMKSVISPLFPSIKANNYELLITKFIGVIVVLIAFNMIFMKDHIFEMLMVMNNFWCPFIDIPLLMGLAGMRIKSSNFKYVVITSTLTLGMIHIFYGDYDVISLCMVIAVSAVTILFFRDKTIGKSTPSNEYVYEEKMELNNQSV